MAKDQKIDVLHTCAFCTKLLAEGEDIVWNPNLLLSAHRACAVANNMNITEEKPVQKKRQDWDEYFMEVARTVSTRATCDRKHVGAIIVDPKERYIVSTGYNGSLSGELHCDERGHLMVDGHCMRTIHAEHNAIYQAQKRGIDTDGMTLYTTASPCWECIHRAKDAGIGRVVFGEFYRDTRIPEFCRKHGIELKGPHAPPAPEPAAVSLPVAQNG